MRLFIAEKPSLARAIADAFPGPTARARDHIRCGPNDVVAWCAGHILETAPPEAYGEHYKAWSLAHLPIVPREWKLQPSIPELLASLRRLLKDADRVVHAGDPDREGQLLVDEVLAFLGYRGPVDRLLVSDLNPAAVRQQLQAIEPNAKYRSLSDSALARQRADRLFGMNMTRLYTLLGRQAGYDGVLSVGRVQTPLLGLIVRRDRAIETFRPMPFFTVVATLRTDAGDAFRATWVPGAEHAAHLDPDKRLLHRELADTVMRATAGTLGRLATRSDKPTREAPPLPYALADLQVDAGKRLGLSAQQVLDACQSLYETHQLTTYPRSDCPYLPSAHHAQASAVLAAAARQLPSLAPLIAAADLSLRSKAWDDAKVTAHHAIIPTPATGPARSLDATEAAVYELVVRRTLAQFYPAFAYIQSELTVDLAGYAFRATGRQVTAQGWKAVLSRAEPEPDPKASAEELAANPSLPPVRAGDPLRVGDVAVAEKKTQPPKSFTDASLIQAMCQVAHYVTDPAIKKILSEADGIGTPATRTAIIETLFTRGYVSRSKKTIVATPTGRALIDALPDVATTPDMTAVWEAGMRVILEGRQPLDAFLTRVEAQLRQLVASAVARGPITVAQRAPTPPAHARPGRTTPAASARRGGSPSAPAQASSVAHRPRPPGSR